MSYLYYNPQTAINRSRASAPAQWLLQHRGMLRGRVLDFGCGRGADLRAFRAAGIDADGFDPHWGPDTLPDCRAYDTITCTYVLNVIPRADRREVLQTIRASLAPDGNAYIAVRRDIPKDSDGPTQYWVELPFPTIMRRAGAFTIYRVSR